MGKGEFDYLTREPKYPRELLKWKKAAEEPLVHLKEIISLLESLPESSFTKSCVRDALIAYAEARGKGNVLWPMRIALSGREQSPDPFTLAAILGKKISLGRLERAIAMLQ